MDLTSALTVRDSRSSGGIYWSGDPMSGLAQFYNPGMPAAKVNITEASSLTISALFAAVRVISKQIAGLDLNVFQIGADGSKTKRRDHRLWDMLDNEPNEEMSSHDFWSLLIAQGLVFGNAFAEIIRDRSGRAIALEPIHASQVRLARDETGKAYYVVHSSVRIEMADMIHIKNVLMNSGIMAEMTTRLAKDSLSLAKAAELYAASFFGNGAVPSMIVKTPKMKPEDKAQFLSEMKAHHGGSSNANKNAVFDQGFDVEVLEPDNQAYQMIETRLLSIEEVCRWTGIQPHLVSHLVKSSFNTIEAQSLDFANTTCGPWIKQIEGELRRKLLTKPERQSWDIKFDLRGLISADGLARAQMYQIFRNIGVMNGDEIRDDLDLSPQPDEVGKKFLVLENFKTD